MNKQIASIALAGLLAGCAPANTSTTGPDIGFDEGARVFSLQVNRTPIGAQSDTWAYSTPAYDIKIKVARRYFNVEIINKTEQSAQILWDNSSILLPDGRSSRIAVEQRTYVSKLPPQAPTVIDAKDRMVDNFFPLLSMGARTYSGVYSDPMFAYPIRATTRIHLILNLQVGAQTSTTDFVFTAQPN